MAVIVTDNCEGCRFTECVKVCPVACFHGDERMVYIDSDACIDCCACIPVCPVQAIYLENDLPPEKAEWIGINRERAAVLPLVTEGADPLPTAAAKRAALGF
ncbi:MAG: ferredoxin family protein [Burkholderiales bacterium]|nr:ferredoxin family protein [Burkholderiales bacterium]